MNEGKKILGDERRRVIIDWLKESPLPITGSELAKRANVSRQVIVQDISILKAKNLPILPTAQGYLLLQNEPPKRVSRIIACKHDSTQAQEELLTIVDHGVTVVNVIVEHAIYGELTASLMISTRKDVEQFCQNLSKTKASLLSDLTEGVHLHTIEANSEKQLDEVEQALSNKGIILK
ncbi:transcription repressor NadR [Halalkalibacter urbisdiaboli]|uniref:transcription repressor NadR n=1 Tax=Halalkalibacter urbisdiaboli TaxID=1960589 RepID=UPI000B446EAE|nr:transcription repressor NadR [Halalkalibacter urbisdiaboli]